PSIDHAPHIRCPIVQLHGTADEVVPYRQGKDLFAAFPERSHNGIEKTWIDLPGARHNTLPISRLHHAAHQLFARLQQTSGEAVARTSGDPLPASPAQ